MLAVFTRHVADDPVRAFVVGEVLVLAVVYALAAARQVRWLRSPNTGGKQWRQVRIGRLCSQLGVLCFCALAFGLLLHRWSHHITWRLPLIEAVVLLTFAAWTLIDRQEYIS